MKHSSNTSVVVSDIKAGYVTTLFLRKREWQYKKPSTTLFSEWKTNYTRLIDKFSTGNISLSTAFDMVCNLLNWELYLWFQRDFTYCPAFLQTSWPLVKCTKSLKQGKSSLQNILSNFKPVYFQNYSYWRIFFFPRSLQSCWVFFLLNYQPIPPTVTADFLPYSRIFNRA